MKVSWWADKISLDEVGRRDLKFIRFVMMFIAPLVRLWHRPAFERIERLPTDRPFLLVANHSGGVAAAEIASFVVVFIERFGAELPFAGLAHPLGFVVWPYNIVVRALGAVPSTYQAAVQALERGVPVLVFPGGDHEATRPVWQAGRVDFNNRRGFLKIARETGVAIVPMGIRGSHVTVPILWRSDFVLPWLLVLPKILGLKRFPLTLVALAGSVAIGVIAPPYVGWGWTVALIWLWMVSPFQFFPILPNTVRLRIGDAIEPETLFTDDDPDLDRAYSTVTARIQALVDAQDD